MPDLTPYIARFFETCDRIQAEWSARWREHANRRTIIVLIISGAIAIASYVEVIRPSDIFPINTLITVPAGASLSQIAEDLHRDGIIRSPLAFKVLAVLMRHGRDLRAGDYLFKEPRDLFAVTRAISIGAYGLEPLEIRVPEGATTKEMTIVFGSRLQRFDKEKFIAIAQPMEGYLFPDTYFFLPNATDETVLEALRQNFSAHLNATTTAGVTLAQLVDKSGHSLDDIVIMASILEREADGRGDDRRKIAGVLWNRLGRGMALQVDATFLYTIGKGSFALTIKDLKSDSPYNTYVHKGLPPGAIGSPSLNSLIAAATPIKNDYLFYLADSNGVTHYSKTYRQHLAKKNVYIGN